MGGTLRLSLYTLLKDIIFGLGQNRCQNGSREGRTIAFFHRRVDGQGLGAYDPGGAGGHIVMPATHAMTRFWTDKCLMKRRTCFRTRMA